MLNIDAPGWNLIAIHELIILSFATLLVFFFPLVEFFSLSLSLSLSLS